jgi:hypothetical protein
MSKDTDDKFSAKETQQRFEAALRGARIAGHKPMPKKPARKRRRVIKPKRG